MQAERVQRQRQTLKINTEISKEATVSKMETVQIEGKRTIVRYMDYYNLDMILSIGYRVNSKRAVAFRQWPTKILKGHYGQSGSKFD